MAVPTDCWTSGDADGERRFHVPITVRWRDLDAYGHVNNAAMLTLLEEARVQAFWEAPDERERAPRPLGVVSAGGGGKTLALVAAHSVEYRAPIPHHFAPIDVQLWVSNLSAASADVSYEVWSPVDDAERTLYTLARTTIVFIDAQTGRPRRVSGVERDAWQRYIGPPVELRSDRRHCT